MVQPVGTPNSAQPPAFREVQERRTPSGVGEQVTTVSAQSRPKAPGYVETLLIKIKNFVVWLVKLICCMKSQEANQSPSASTPEAAAERRSTSEPVQVQSASPPTQEAAAQPPVMTEGRVLPAPTRDEVEELPAVNPNVARDISEDLFALQLVDRVLGMDPLHQAIIYNKVGRNVYHESGLLGWVTSYERIGRNAITSDPKLLIPLRDEILRDG